MTETGNIGIVLLVHGGSPAWNQAVEDLAISLREQYSVIVSTGMSNIDGLTQAADRLINSGCNEVHIIRLSIYSPVFNERHRSTRDRLKSSYPDTRIEWHGNGLVNAVETDSILLDRAQALSTRPELERILFLAHGAASDDDDASCIQALQQRAELTETSIGPESIWCTTLREDWPEKRQKAESAIRSWVKQAEADGMTVLVIPVRLFGFGPYASVLNDLTYQSQGLGLLPHPLIEKWIVRTIGHES